MKISIVIGTFNQKDILKKTLKSLIKQDFPKDQYEIIVVDSMSSDGTEKMVKEFDIRYIRRKNKGKSIARNKGILEASGEIILLTDADMVATPNLVAEHVKAHQNKKNAIFEGLTINPDGKPYIKEKIKPWQKLRWSYFLTGNLSIQRKTILKAGLFDPHFKGYGWEDIELGYRLHKMRIPIYYLPSAINNHEHPVSNEDMLKRKYSMGQSAAYFYKKHPDFAIKMFLGLNPLAMLIFHILDKYPNLRKKIKNQYILEEYYYRLGLTEELTK